MAAYSSSRAIFEVLREVCASPRAVGVTELSRRLQLSSSTTQRALQVLAQSEFLSRHPATPKYRSGFIAERLVNALLERYPIRAVSLVPLRRLAVSSHRTASLYIRLGGTAFASPASSQDRSALHRRAELWPAGRRSPSLAVLALLSPTRWRRTELRKPTPEGLDELLDEVRSKFAYTAPSGGESSRSRFGGYGARRHQVCHHHQGPLVLSLGRAPAPERGRIVHEFELTLARKAQLYTDPFATSTRITSVSGADVHHHSLNREQNMAVYESIFLAQDHVARSPEPPRRRNALSLEMRRELVTALKAAERTMRWRSC
jgi:hypothetical protein